MRSDSDTREDLITDLVEDLPLAVSELDMSGRIRFANTAYAQITGYDVEELVGMSVAELIAPGPERDEFPALLKRLADETPEPFVYTGVNINRDGRRMHVEVLWDYRRDQEGRVTGYACALKDITEHVESEKQYRLSEERFRRMFEQSPFGTVVYRPDGRPLYVNPTQKKLMGLSDEEMTVAMAHYNVMEDQQLVHLGLMPYIEQGFSGEPVAVPAAYYEPRQMEPRLDHEGLWLRGFIYPLRSPTGDIREVVITFEDITAAMEAEKLEERLQQAQKLESLAVLTGGIAHDFNNLLGAILGNADLALRKLPPDSPVREAAADIVAAASSAAGLVQEMLAYSGQCPIEKELLDLSKVVDEVSHLADAAISKKAIVHKELARDIPYIEGDASQLRQIVLNLIINASEARADDDASVTISIRTGVVEAQEADLKGSYLDDDLPPGIYCVLEIADTGVGMDAETKGRLFEPFFSTKFDGRGLGLASVLGIVRGHGGAINVDSTLGEGTTFRILLPASSGVAKPEATPRADEDWRGEGTILLVEDNAIVRTVAQHMLHDLGFDVVTASDGRRALGLVRDEPGRFGCILLDVAMPEMDGVECFDRLVELGCEVPVLVASGYGHREVARLFAGRHPAGYLHKPYDLEELREALHAVFA